MAVLTARNAAATKSNAIVLAVGIVLGVAAVAAVTAILRAPPSAPASTVTPSDVMDRVERRASIDEAGMDIEAILATPEYFRITGQPALAQRVADSGEVDVILTQDIHFGTLPPGLAPTMLIDGRAYAPTKTDTVFDSDHHRTTVLTYTDPSIALASAVAVAELQIPSAVGDLRWERPYQDAAQGSTSGLPLPLILALMGGMLASMWPCLFQLTAYFLPSVAGLSLEEAQSGRADRAVLRTAVLFVTGIVIVYTLAGLAAGFAAQSVSGTALFQQAKQPLTFVAGLVIIGMAVRLALTARRPLACHMPTKAPSRRQCLGTVALGLAFATGCMSCFGAAVVLGMFTYVVTTASPFVGAAILFVFSLGIAVPLVIAALAMARVLPLLTRLQVAMPAMTVVSALIMGAYGVLLMTGTSHVMSDAIARVANGFR